MERQVKSVAIGVWLLAVAIGVLPVQAENLTWNATGGVWSVGANWAGGSGNPPADNDTVQFLSIGAGSTNTNDIAGLSLNSFVVSSASHTIDLGGNVLTTRTFAVAGSGAGVTGTLHLANGDLSVTNALDIAYGADEDAVLTLASDVGLTIGSESNRAVLRVREGDPTVAGTKGSLTASGSFNAWLTELNVGHRGTGFTTGNQYGLLDLSGVTEAGVLNVSGNVRIGNGMRAAGEVLIGDAIAFRIGSETARGGRLSIGIHRKNVAVTNRLVLGTNRFDAYVSSLNVGESSGNVAEPAIGILDASAVFAGVLDVAGSAVIGRHPGNSVATWGTVLVSDGMDVKIGDLDAGRGELIVGDNLGGFDASLFQLGRGRFEAYITNFVVGNTNQTAYAARNNEFHAGDVTEGVLDLIGPFWVGRGVSVDRTNRVTLSDNFVTTIGADAQRSSMAVADAARAGVARVVAGGSFSAYLESLTVGRNTHATASTANGLLDLSSVTNGFLNVSGTVVIGWGVAGVGVVRLPKMAVTAADLGVGSTFANSRGTLIMTGAVFSVTSSVTLDGPSAANRAQILTAVAGQPAGLDLGPGATLTVNQGLISNVFQNVEQYVPIYWGLRWESNAVAELNALKTAGKLGWDASAVVNPMVEPIDIFYDGTYTYVGAKMLKPKGTLIAIQ